MERQTGKRHSESVAVKTTIVGGRPPGSGRSHGDIPRGIEILVKKASLDRDFRQVLLEQRAEAAHALGLELTEPEMTMLNATPEDQLATVIDSTRVQASQHAAFMGNSAESMLAAAKAPADQSEKDA